MICSSISAPTRLASSSMRSWWTASRARLQVKLAGDSGPPVEDASQFRSIAGALQYLTFTRPNITYVMQQIYLHMHDPWEPHLTAMKRILRYLQGTPDYGLFCVVRAALTSSSTRMLTGPIVQTLTTLRLAMRRSWGTTWFPSRPSGRLSSPAPALRPSIVSLPTAWLRPLGCVSCFTSFRPHRLGEHLSTATISSPCTYSPTPFSINAPNMWRLIFILSERMLPLVKSASSMSRRHHSLSTSS
jgi:hypothetical protein